MSETRRDLNRLLYPLIPLLPAFTLVPWYLFSYQTTWEEWAWAALAFFLFDNLGVQLGVHKLLAHKAFSTDPVTKRVLAFLSILSGQGSPLVWVAVHMGNHHPGYDTDKDLHSPRHGWAYAFLSWYWKVDTSKINFRPARAYFTDPFLMFAHRHHALLLLAYWTLLGMVGGKTALVFGGLLPVVMSVTLAGLVNAALHGPPRASESVLMKYQNHPGDTTYNSVFLGLFTMGLGLHNNHHSDPSALYYDQRWFEFDPSRLVVPLLRKW